MVLVGTEFALTGRLLEIPSFLGLGGEFISCRASSKYLNTFERDANFHSSLVWLQLDIQVGALRGASCNFHEEMEY